MHVRHRICHAHNQKHAQCRHRPTAAIPRSAPLTIPSLPLDASETKKTHVHTPPLRVPLSLLRSHHPTISPNVLRLFLVALGNMVERVMVQTVASLFSRGAITPQPLFVNKRDAKHRGARWKKLLQIIKFTSDTPPCHPLPPTDRFRWLHCEHRCASSHGHDLQDVHVSVCCRSPPRGCVSRQPHVHLVARIDTLNQCPHLIIRSCTEPFHIQHKHGQALPTQHHCSNLVTRDVRERVRYT